MSEFSFHDIKFRVFEKIEGEDSEVDDDIVEKILNREGFLTKQLHIHTFYKSKLASEFEKDKLYPYPQTTRTFSVNEDGTYLEDVNGEYIGTIRLKPEFSKTYAARDIGISIDDIVEVVENENSYMVRYTSEFYLYDINIDEIAWFLKHYSFCTIKSDTYLDVNRFWVKIANINLNEKVRTYE